MVDQKNLSGPVALRLPREVLEEIETIATICGRSRSWVMVRAMKAYLATEGKEIQAIDAANRQMAEGKYHDLDDVLREAVSKEAAA